MDTKTVAHLNQAINYDGERNGTPELYQRMAKPDRNVQVMQIKLADMRIKVQAARLPVRPAASNAEDDLPSVLGRRFGQRR